MSNFFKFTEEKNIAFSNFIIKPEKPQNRVWIIIIQIEHENQFNRTAVNSHGLPLSHL